ncbi:hypothetical protein K469DRAFT_715212 [Zopfia rhizophila CBS 207.26]|uniref:Secreted protein n=1 Tax=Zopfia rhizophila CBS 207.26 TaxID=1314779 RepID=A0A6A6EQV8_9PEZI|nr:hypothetical protein K469DRAFT_715212 [Zopfia rhizophila CBS 207.26]
MRKFSLPFSFILQLFIFSLSRPLSFRRDPSSFSTPEKSHRTASVPSSDKAPDIACQGWYNGRQHAHSITRKTLHLGWAMRSVLEMEAESINQHAMA